MNMEETALVKVNPSIDSAVAALHSRALWFQAAADELVIASDDDVTNAITDLSTIASIKKAIEDKRKEYTQPLNNHLKAINNAFKSFTEPILYADKLVRRKVLDYQAERDRQRQEAAPTLYHTDDGTTSKVSIRKWELVDFSQVPDEYKAIDAVKIGKVVRAGIPSIPGIRIWQEETLRVGTK
jgi:hypothetical protein